MTRGGIDLGRARALREPGAAVPLIVLAAVSVSVVAVLSPKVALAGLGLAAVVYIGRRRPSAALIVWSGLLYLEAMAVPNLAIKALLPVVALALLRPRAVTIPRPRVSVTFSWTVVSLGLLSVWLLASLTWAIEVGRVVEFIRVWVPMAALFLVIAYRAPSVASIRLVVAALVVSATVSVLTGLGGDGSIDASDEIVRLAGGAADPNFLAAGLPAALVFGLVWLFRLERITARLVTAVALGVVLVGLVLTGSRGGLVALVALIPAAVILSGPARGRAVVGLISAVLLVGPLVFMTSTWDRIFDGEGGTGREELWAIAVDVTAGRPFTGVGPDNFGLVAPEYVRDVGQLGFVDLIVNRPHQVHNVYLQLAAETGLVGLILFLSFVVGSMTCAVKAGRTFASAGNLGASHLASAVAMAGWSMLIAAVFLPFLFDKRLWLVLALGPALERISGFAVQGREVEVDR